MGDVNADYRTIRTTAGAVWLDRDFIRVSGPDTISFLQGQLSQDIVAMDVGGSAWSWVLEPQGKVTALIRAIRLEPDVVLLDTDAGWGDVVRERLTRFKLRTKADLEPIAWRVLAVRGPEAPVLGEGSTVALTVDASWPGLTGVDLIGETVDVPAAVPLVEKTAYEVARIEAGVPVMGAELSERTIPAETGIIDRTVSFTKGCYTGQELVARIDSRGGHVPRHLRGVWLDGPAPPGASVEVNGKAVGALTSVAALPDRAVALAYVRRDVEPPADAVVTWDGGQAGGRVETLPLGPPAGM